MPDPQDAIPNDPDVTPEHIGPGADLAGADLTDAYLRSADLTDADLAGADLTDADLYKADLPGANLREADLSEANLRKADLTDARLKEADLTDANLRRADLTNANLAEVDLSGIILSRSTQIDAPGERITTEAVDIDSISEEQRYDVIARANHELRTAYSANGFTGRARRARVRERRARRKEAFAEGGLVSWGTVAWFGSLLSKVFTGYGVQLFWVAVVIAVLYLGSAGVYHYVGEMSVGRSLYYSVVTFTTSPPSSPPEGLTSVVAGVETFAGTAAIVFLGYVLGTRERV